jgi:hypothetical protein
MIRSLLACVAAGAVGASAAGGTQTPSRVIHTGCPPAFAGAAAGEMTVDQAMAVARAVAIDHRVDHYQGHAIRRTPANYPVLEVVRFSDGPPVLPGEQALKKIAAKRCGGFTAYFSAAVVFAISQSPVCCLRDTRFVVHLRRGWWVY